MIDRVDDGHLVLAAGIRLCLGAHLAGLEGQIVCSRLVRRFAYIQAAGPRSAVRP
ncbi:hypothetical protein [Streptomyces sp. NPDC018610]|uniref:hypothetical protein n=1 Tax=Streptomyces sp. NPDC018610 TaxID=3365049 RepID=UPI0037902D63